MEMFAALEGEHWDRHDYWGTDKPLAQWFGIIVNRAGYVVELQLASNNLNGSKSNIFDRSIYIFIF